MGGMGNESQIEASRILGSSGWGLQEEVQPSNLALGIFHVEMRSVLEEREHTSSQDLNYVHPSVDVTHIKKATV